MSNKKPNKKFNIIDIIILAISAGLYIKYIIALFDSIVFMLGGSTMTYDKLWQNTIVVIALSIVDFLYFEVKDSY